MVDRSEGSGDEIDARLRVEELEERLAEAEMELDEREDGDLSEEAPFAAEWRAFVRSTEDFVGIATTDEVAAFVNPAGRRMCGLDPDEEVRGTPVPRFHPDWAARRVVEEGIPTALEQGAWVGESALATPDGEVPVRQIILAHPDADGEVRYLYTIMRPLEPGSSNGG